MKVQEKIQTLLDLGLTLRQAKVYLTLSHLGESTTQQISKDSKINREDLYRILATLEDLSLIEKVVTTPTTFRAIPINLALELLYGRKSDKLSHLKKNIKKLQTNEKKFESTKPNKNETEIILMPKMEPLILRRRKALTNAIMTVDIINTWKRHIQTSHYYYETAKNALQRGVRIRIIINRPKEPKQLRILSDLKKFSNFEVKFLDSPPSTLLSIYDKKEAFVATVSRTPLGESPAYWTNNHSLLTITQGYFESVWLKQTEEDYTLKLPTT